MNDIEELFIIKGTDSILDYAEAACGPPLAVKYRDKKSGEISLLVIRELVEVYNQDYEYSFENIKGVFIDDSKLEKVVEEESAESFLPGKHIKTYSVTVSGYHIALAEYEDIIQLAITNPNDTIKSYYLSKIHLGGVKYIMDYCHSEEQVKKIIDFAEKFKL